MCLLLDTGNDSRLPKARAVELSKSHLLGTSIPGDNSSYKVAEWLRTSHADGHNEAGVQTAPVETDDTVTAIPIYHYTETAVQTTSAGDSDGRNLLAVAPKNTSLADAGIQAVLNNSRVDKSTTPGLGAQATYANVTSQDCLSPRVNAGVQISPPGTWSERPKADISYSAEMAVQTSAPGVVPSALDSSENQCTDAFNIVSADSAGNIASVAEMGVQTAGKLTSTSVGIHEPVGVQAELVHTSPLHSPISPPQNEAGVQTSAANDFTGADLSQPYLLIADQQQNADMGIQTMTDMPSPNDISGLLHRSWASQTEALNALGSKYIIIINIIIIIIIIIIIGKSPTKR